MGSSDGEEAKQEVRSQTATEESGEGEADIADVEDGEGSVEEEEGAAAASAEQVASQEVTTKDTEEDEKEQSRAGVDVDINNFTELRLDENIISAAENAWKVYIGSAESREAAGEAIYAALFEGAPSLQSLFVTPRAVQAMRFMNGLANFVGHLHDPKALKIQVETLGFGHLHLDVTVPRVVIFRDAIMDLLTVELGERFDALAEKGWKRLLNYVGGAIIYIKANYAERITTLLSSWKIASENGKGEDTNGGEDGAAAKHAAEKAEAENNKKSAKSTGMASMFGKKAQTKQGGSETGGESDAKGDKNNQNSAQNVPKTYEEMFKFNSAVMGFGNKLWLNEVLDCFHNIVTNVQNSARLQEECDVLGLRIARVSQGPVNLAEYKSCMLASLRSLLPKDWSTAHEVAWSWLWENVERLLQRNMGKPAIWEKALAKLLASIDEQQKFQLRASIYTRFFELAPGGQDYFKQSNTYLHVIADRIIDMTIGFFVTPVKLVDDISALGLRHVGYGIPTEYMSPFVTACCEVVQTYTKDVDAIESFRWSLALVSKTLVRTITEGSTIVMKAVNNNSIKLLKKAISCAPRGERMQWILLVQVGTQNISPLYWAIRSGALESAGAMIKDLLTIRADRDKYYYGTDELFSRHPDLVKIISEEAPVLLPMVLDGLVWRSRLTDGGLRRVNYFIKHLLVDSDGNFAKALEWIAHSKDPKIVCHPVVVLLSDLVWSGVASRSFFWRKAWFLFTLVVFIISQSILENIGNENQGHHKTENQRLSIFCCRCFIYTFSLTGFISTHANKIYTSIRKKDFTKVYGIVPMPKYLCVWQEMASFTLTAHLILMLALEPILWCWSSAGEELFIEECHAAEPIHFPYSVVSMIAMFIYFILLMVLAVFNMRVSAYVLVCQRMLSEVGLFIFALMSVIFCTASSVSVLEQDNPEFAGIHKGGLTLLKMFMRVYNISHYEAVQHEPVEFLCVALFLVISAVFLLNLLIAQLTCAYQAVYVDMVGFARLERIDIIVETMVLVSGRRWTRFIEDLRLSERLEFNEGDIGLSGAIQVLELASANPTTEDMIHRFGGSTSPSIQWPEEEEGEGDEDDRWDRLEQMIQKTLKRLAKSGSRRQNAGGRGSSSGGMGSSGKGTNSGGGSDKSGASSAGGEEGGED